MKKKAPRRKYIKTPFYVSVPLLINDPTMGQSKIGTDKWSIFLHDIRDESHILTEACNKASQDHAQVNDEFKRTAQLSFNAIHNVKRNRPLPDNMIPRVPHPKPKVEGNNDFDDFSIFTTTSPTKFKYNEFPKRASSAVRYLKPDKLSSVYNVKKREMDEFVITGEQLDGNEAY
ncbi:hypothetical protein M9Y10_016492 [Tritrichomonas musculus]|uniref:Uncharacterized protein n=1 Tax=Tritrichomonas musculus TaxID=1915356 RepID=A0ABR2HWB7_9EUKA